MATFLQEARLTSSTPADTSLAFGSNVSAGSLLIALIREGATPSAAPIITDSRSNTWTIAQQTGAGNRQTIAWAVNASAGACTVSVDVGQTTSTRMILLEFSGTWGSGPTVATSTAVSSTTSPIATSGVSGTSPGGVVVAFLGTTSDATPFAVSAGGYTITNNSVLRAVAAWQTFTSAGTYTCTFTAGSGISGGSNAQNLAFMEVAASTKRREQFRLRKSHAVRTYY